MAKQRLDVLLCERGLFETRSRAAAAVLAGEVRVGAAGARAAKPGQLAGAEVGAEVAADLAHGLDDVLAHLLGDARQLLVAEAVQILRAVDPVEQSVWRREGHEVRV